VTDPGEVKGNRILEEIAARALTDDDYRDELLADPAAVLSAAELDVPEDVEVVVIQNTASRVHLVLPSKPRPEQDLDKDEVKLLKLIPFHVF
jgi:hypothetical protein